MLNDLEQQYFVTMRDIADRFLFGDMTWQVGMRIALDVAVIANASAFLDGAETKKWWLLDEGQRNGMAETLRGVADVFRTLYQDAMNESCAIDPHIKTKLLLTTRLLRHAWDLGAMVENEVLDEG